MKNMENLTTKTTPLSEIAEILMGATTRFYTESETADAQSAQLLTGICLDKRGNYIKERTKAVWMLDGASRYVPEINDVLIVTRGRIRALAVTPETFSNTNEKIIVSANYSIVRLRDRQFNPQYIAELFCNLDYMERIGILFGTALPSISRRVLSNAKIPCIDQDKQSAIAELRKAREKAYEATISLAEQNIVAADTLIQEMVWGRP